MADLVKLPTCQFWTADNSPPGGHDCEDPASYKLLCEDGTTLLLCEQHAREIEEKECTA
jgi:hypothetical protein